MNSKASPSKSQLQVIGTAALVGGVGTTVYGVHHLNKSYAEKPIRFFGHHTLKAGAGLIAGSLAVTYGLNAHLKASGYKPKKY